jgi:uncharacterized protein with beta-barrel porin domain
MIATDTRLAVIAHAADFACTPGAWAGDFVNNPALAAAFQVLPGSNFIVNGAPIRHDSALTSADVKLFLAPNGTLLAKFDGEFARGAQTYAGTGTLRYTW